MLKSKAVKTKTNGMAENRCKKSETEIILKTRRRPRFKAGSDLSSKVNRVAVEINEESTEEHEMIELKVQLFREECAKTECSEA